jgi:hypothetical protein
MGVCAAVAAIAGAVIGAGVAIHGQEVQKNQLEANAAHDAEQAAADAAAQKGAAQVEAERIRKAAKQQRAQAVAAAAASGVDVNSPTAVKIDETVNKNAETDAALTLYNGADTAARINQQGQASLINAKAQGKAIGTQQIGTLLSGVSAATNYGQGWKKAG